MTGLDLCIAAAREIGVIGQAQSTLSDASLQIIFAKLNLLIDASSARKGLLFSKRLDSLTLTIGQQFYTIGIDPQGIATANFSVPRPVTIAHANLLITSQVRRPLKLLTNDDWAAIRYQAVSGPPIGVYNDAGYTTGFATLRFDRIPDQAYGWEIWSWLQNAQLATPTSQINYPPGYGNFWLCLLARSICRPFGRAITADLEEDCRIAVETVEGLNCETPKLAMEPALAGPNDGLYNWLDGLME